MSIGTMAPDESAFWTMEADTTGGGPVPVVDARAIRMDPTAEYIAGGVGFFRTIGLAALPTSIDHFTRKYGWRGYDAMREHPAVSSSLRTLQLGAMGGDLLFTPTDPVKPGEKGMNRDQRRSKDAVDFLQRMVNRTRGFRSSCHELLAAIHRGNKLAEMTAREETVGPDAGRLVLKSLHVKHEDTFQYAVDDAWDVVGILFRDRDGFLRRADVDKFVRVAFMPENNDPRGTTVLRAAWYAWNILIRIYPQWHKYLSQFAVPSLIGETSPNDKADRIVNGVKLNPNQYFKLILELFQNGSVLVVPNGAKVTPLQISGEGLAFLNAFEYLTREIIHAILLQTRATKEAENGSKKDSEVAQDVMDLLITYIREMVATALREQCFYTYLALNFGQAFADRYNPYVYFGGGPAPDKIEKWKAAAPLINGGAITDSIKADFYADAELPVPDVDADKESAREAMEQQKKTVGGQEGGQGDGQDGGGDGEKDGGDE